MTEVSTEIQQDKNSKIPVFKKGNEYSAEPVLENFLGEVWYNLGLVTKKIGEKRVTAPMRKGRADLYKSSDIARESKIGSIERVRFHQNYETMARLERELVDQMDLEVKTIYGDLKAKYTILNREAKEDQPPIVIIPGSSNGIESMDSFVRELAKQNPDRRIYVVGYPDAPSGEVTPEFYRAVTTANGYEPHQEYFRKAISKLYPSGDFEVGAYSGGCAITANILYNTNLSERVTNAWLMCPAGSMEMSNATFKAGVIYENWQLLKYLGSDLPNYNFVDDKSRDEQKTMKFEIWKALGDRCRRNVMGKMMGLMRVKEGGKIMIISAEKDHLTYSAEMFNKETEQDLRKRQKNLHISVVKGRPHAGIFLFPEEFLAARRQLMAEA